jgi:hypothetical protein
VEDPRTDLVRLVRESGDDPRPFLRQHDVFGDLGADDAFTATVTGHLAALEEDGPRGAVARCLGDTVRSLR